MKEQNVQILDRIMDIIELMATSPRGMGVTEIGMKLNLHKSTVHRLINALLRRGYIEKEQKTGLYRIGLKFVEISSMYMHQLELKTEALPYMRRLAETAGQVAHLAILDETDAVYIEKVDVFQSLRLYSQIGKRIPAYCSALGKVLLAGQNKSRLMQIMENLNLEPYTPNTITDHKTLAAELEKIRERGWAVDDEEYEHGVRCIAAPIRDFTGRVIAALSVSGGFNIDKNQEENYIGLVVEAAGKISGRMGYISNTANDSGSHDL